METVTILWNQYAFPDCWTLEQENRGGRKRFSPTSRPREENGGQGFLDRNSGPASEVPTVHIGLIVQSIGDSQSMRIPILIESTKSNKNAEAAALIDSGAAGHFIDWGFVRRNNIRTHDIDDPIEVRNVDGTPNKAGSITKACKLYYTLQNRVMTSTFLITTLGGEDVILGLPWLRSINPSIDWAQDLITIQEDPKTAMELRGLRYAHNSQQPRIEEIEDEEFHDAIDIELEEWDPSQDTYPFTAEIFPETPELLPCEEDEEDLEEVRVAYIRGLPLMWDHHERLTDEHIPEEFTFKTRNRTISNVPNSPRFIFNPVLANRKTTTAQTLAEEASLLQKKKTFA